MRQQMISLLSDTDSIQMPAILRERQPANLEIFAGDPASELRHKQRLPPRSARHRRLRRAAGVTRIAQ
jgi:hypothetical protein